MEEVAPSTELLVVQLGYELDVDDGFAVCSSESLGIPASGFVERLPCAEGPAHRRAYLPHSYDILVYSSQLNGR